MTNYKQQVLEKLMDNACTNYSHKESIIDRINKEIDKTVERGHSHVEMTLPPAEGDSTEIAVVAGAFCELNDFHYEVKYVAPNSVLLNINLIPEL